MRDEIDGLTRLTGYLRAALASGQPLPEGLARLARTLSPGRERELMEGLASDLSAGTALSAALQRRLGGRVPPLFAALIAAGERSGQLAASVDALAGYAEAQRDLSRQVSAALLYPRVVVLAMVAVVFPVLAWVQGQLLTDPAYAESAPSGLIHLVDRGMALLLWPYAHGTAPAVLFVAAVAVLVCGGVPPVDRLVARLSRRVFAAGGVRRAQLGAALARGMALLLGAGVPLPEALALLAGASADSEAVRQLTAASISARSGLTLGQVLAPVTALPRSFCWFVESGTAPEQGLAEAARFYQDEARDRAQLLAAAIEPLAVLALAVVFLPSAGVLARLLAATGGLGR